MSLLNYVVVSIVGTILRFFPWPCKTGLYHIGQPDRDSPVLVTCNYRLTVARVQKALQGLNAYLLVANSRGINVWCAATGGLFTNHDVISVLKTSGIEERVDHRQVILPQLAATGVETKVVERKTGWKLIWGPVHAEDISAFLEGKLDKTTGMRVVRFPWTQRLETAVAWAFPISLVLVLAMIPLWREAILPLVLLVWGLSLLIFLAFPLYSRWLASEGRRIGFILFDFGRGGFQVIVWGAIMFALVTHAALVGDLSWGFIARWGVASLVVVLMLSLDLMGSTPVYKSGLHEDRLLRVVLDQDKCRGVGYCEDVCPRDCYHVDRDRHTATMSRAERCVQCGACIVQCPFDALHFRSPKGEVIPPETIRKFKLNLMGKRLVR